jgi:hypothetical protein
MSEMGHLRRFGDVRDMSALARFADYLNRRAMSHKCHTRTYAPQQIRSP